MDGSSTMKHYLAIKNDIQINDHSKLLLILHCNSLSPIALVHLFVSCCFMSLINANYLTRFCKGYGKTEKEGQALIISLVTLRNIKREAQKKKKKKRDAQKAGNDKTQHISHLKTLEFSARSL